MKPVSAYSNFSPERMPVQRAIFLSAGGEDYEFIACLNERDTWIRVLMMIALENLHGWLPVAWDAARANLDADRSLALASAMGRNVGSSAGGWVERQRNPSHRHHCQAPHPTPAKKLRAADYPGTKLLPV